MVKQGILQVDNIIYDIYLTEDIGFTRIDILEQGADRYIDTSKVKFSLFQKRTTKIYGDKRLYYKYLDLQKISQLLSLKRRTTSKWEDSKFITHDMASDGTNAYESILVNGKLDTLRISTATDLLYIKVMESSGIQIEPINFADYVDVTSTLQTNIQNIKTPYVPLSTLRRQLDIAHLDDNDFANPATVEEARIRLKAWVDSPSRFKGIDTETTGTDFCLYGEDKLVGVVLAQDTHTSTYFSFRHEAYENLPMSFLDELMQAVKSQESKLVAHNGKFDRKVFMSEGYDIRFAYDTLPLSFMINPVLKAGTHALKTLIEEISGKRYIELSDIFLSTKEVHFQILPRDLVQAYACPDASNTIAVLEHLLDKLPQSMLAMYLVECALVALKADQEYYGMRVDVAKYEKDHENCKYCLEQLEKAFRQLTKIDGNINSSATLADLIYIKMRCPVQVRTNTNKPSVSSKAISKLIKEKATVPHNLTGDLVDLYGKPIVTAEELNKTKYPALLILSKYKLYQKQYTAFYARFERTVKHGRIFFWINQNGAQTGRQSSPMHQLPPSLKEVIISDSDRHQLVDCDYSAIELRMLAFLSGEKSLMKLCEDPDNDIHRVIGSLISDKPMYAITDEERALGKRRNFGVAYLISAHGLSDQINGPGGTKEQIDQCENLLHEFYTKFKYITLFIDRNKNDVVTKGFTSSKWGRRRLFPEINNPNISKRQHASLLRQGNNMVVQGSAADYLKIAEVNYYNYIREKGWNEIGPDGLPMVRVMLSIHDEVMLSADKSIPYEEIILMIRTCMEVPVEGAPPFFVSPIFCDNWEGHNDSSLEIPVRLRDKLIDDYIRTGKSSINASNYRETLNNYRDGVLRDYMQDIVDRVGTDPNKVYLEVTHPSLTHALLNRYKKDIPKSYAHEQKILEATKLYLAGADFSKKDIETDTKEITAVSVEDLDVLVDFDQDGNIVYPYQEEADMDVIEEDYVVENTGNIYSDLRVFKIGNAVFLDLDKLSIDEADKIINYLWKDRVEDGFYPIYIMYNNKSVDAGFCVEDIDVQHINDMILKEEKNNAYV